MAKVKRRVKKPEERRAEILEAARRLFAEKGYEATSVSDIVRSLKVAQGTFYWYFSSKEEVFYEVARLYADSFLKEIKEIVERNDLSALEKTGRIIEAFVGKKTGWEREVVDRLHSPSERALHDRIAYEYSLKLLPLLVSVIRQGVGEGVFNTDYPEEAAAFMLAMGNLQHVLDPTQLSEKEKKRWALAFVQFLMKGLGCADEAQVQLQRLLQIKPSR